MNTTPSYIKLIYMTHLNRDSGCALIPSNEPTNPPRKQQQEDYDETAHVLERGAGAQEIRVVKDAKRETRYVRLVCWLTDLLACLCLIMCVYIFIRACPLPQGRRPNTHHPTQTHTQPPQQNQAPPPPRGDARLRRAPHRQAAQVAHRRRVRATEAGWQGWQGWEEGCGASRWFCWC